MALITKPTGADIAGLDLPGYKPKRLPETQAEAAAQIRYKVGSLPILRGYEVALGIYVPPSTTLGGIIRTEEHMVEWIYQGKVGLVLAIGPLAFKDDAQRSFGGEPWCKVGDFIVTPATSGTRLTWNDWYLRIVDDMKCGVVIPPDVSPERVDTERQHL